MIVVKHAKYLSRLLEALEEFAVQSTSIYLYLSNKYKECNSHIRICLSTCNLGNVLVICKMHIKEMVSIYYEWNE